MTTTGRYCLVDFSILAVGYLFSLQRNSGRAKAGIFQKTTDYQSVRNVELAGVSALYFLH